MGRKEDEEEQSKASKEKLGNCIEELTKKCKPLNIQLNRLDVPKNGVVVIKETSEKVKVSKLNSNDGESSEAIINNVDNAENSNDTAETIKKIKEFIALGRCEDTKKDQDTSDKKVGFVNKVVTKRKSVNKKDKTPSKKSSVSIERLNSEQELEWTLKGHDSVSNVDNVDSVSKGKTVEKNPVFDDISVGDDNESTANDHHDSGIKNIDSLATPSRVSKRIQSKSVKFSVKKMLRGDDVNVLKRMIPGYQDNTPSKKERLTEKKTKLEVKKITAPLKLSPSPVRDHSEEKETEEPSHSVPETPISKKAADISRNISTSVNHNSETNVPSTDIVSPTSVEKLIDNIEKTSSFSNQIGKFAIGNGKITVELKGSQQKKVVRIAVPPIQAQSSLPKTSLGPDIIIKRVKPVKKTVVIPDDPSLGMKGIIEKEVLVEHPPPAVNNKSKEPKLSPRVCLQKVTPPRLKENFVKMHKNILRQRKNDKKLDKTVSKKAEGDIPLQNPNTISTAEVLPITESEHEKLKQNIITSTNVDKDSTKNVDLGSESHGISDKPSTGKRDDFQKQASGDKNQGRKTAKVTPLTQVKSTNDTSPPKSQNKVKKPDKISDKSYFFTEPELFEPEKETYDSLFDRYFSTRERYAQHHDSLDSDSSDDFNDDVYAHFINLKRQKDQIARNEERKEDVTMYDLMRDISLELPTWNIHVTSTGQAFCLAQVDIVDSIPVMKKVIEIDLDYNVKVFVSGTLMPEYVGNYSSYEDIKQLIYDVDQL